MHAWFRTVLVWLLVLALPAQGAAAATLSFCNPHQPAAAGSATAAAAAAIAPADPAAAWQGHGHPPGTLHASTPHHHDPAASPAGHVDAAGSTASAAQGAGDRPATPLAQADQHKCSACAACCFAAVFGRTTLDVPAPDLKSTSFVAVVTAVEKFSADGPDRPPRRPLA